MAESSSKKFCFIVNELYLGGAQRLVVDDVEELRVRGYDVSLVTLRPTADRVTFEHLCHLPEGKRHTIVFSSVFDFGAYRELVALMLREQYDVVITHLWLANTIGRIAAYVAKSRVVIAFEQNVYDNVKSWKQFQMDRLLQNVSTCVVAISEAVKASIMRHGIREEKIRVLVNAIRPEDFQHPVDRANTLTEFGIPDDSFVFITIGRLEKQKAHDTLLRAFKEVPEGYLLIVGEGVLRAYLEEMIVSLGLTGRVFLVGVRKDIPSLLGSSDCFVFPSRYEGVGVVMLEALAAGLPVIATDFGPAREILTDGTDGLIVPIDDMAQLAEKMRTVADSPDLRASLSAAGKVTAGHYSIQNHVDTLLEMIPT